VRRTCLRDPRSRRLRGRVGRAVFDEPRALAHRHGSPGRE
jgi:hypothetical protein